MSTKMIGENEIQPFGVRMFRLIKEITDRDYDLYVDNFLCYMLNRTEWLKMCSKWILGSHKYERTLGKGQDPLRFIPSYIGKIEDIKDSSKWYTEIFINQFWLKMHSGDKYNSFLFSMCHELVHHFEYIDSYFEQKKVNYIQTHQEELFGEYINVYMNTYPRDTKRFKNILKQKNFILKPTPFYLVQNHPPRVPAKRRFLK